MSHPYDCFCSLSLILRYIPPDKREENDQSTHKWMVYVRGSRREPSIHHFVKKVWFFLHPSYKPNDLVEVRFVVYILVEQHFNPPSRTFPDKDGAPLLWHLHFGAVLCGCFKETINVNREDDKLVPLRSRCCFFPSTQCYLLIFCCYYQGGWFAPPLSMQHLPNWSK